MGAGVGDNGSRSGPPPDACTRHRVACLVEALYNGRQWDVATAGWDPFSDELWIPCLRCQPKALDLIRTSHGAKVDEDGLTFECISCRASGTIWLLERLVREDASALRRAIASGLVAS
ncbi:MAG: hypothetical protein ACRCW4_10075 [Candidatus Neomicrothrix subdominans]